MPGEILNDRSCACIRCVRADWVCRLWKGIGIIMINFEEELKKFHPSLEVEDVEDAIYNQDVTDLADVLVKLVKDAKEE